MEEFLPILKECRLFFGVEEANIRSMLGCLQAKACTYPKGAYVLRRGQQLSQILVLVRGKLHIQQDDYWGNRSIINVVEVGELFGEAYASPNSGPLSSDVVALEESTVLAFDMVRILTVCSTACRFHSMVVQNLCYALCEKNQLLVRKLGHLSQRSIREKLMSYLSHQAVKKGSGTFEIPFNRQQLADYLSVDRSALSNELSKMRREGLLTFERSRFSLNLPEQPQL